MMEAGYTKLFEGLKARIAERTVFDVQVESYDFGGKSFVTANWYSTYYNHLSKALHSLCDIGLLSEEDVCELLVWWSETLWSGADKHIDTHDSRGCVYLIPESEWEELSEMENHVIAIMDRDDPEDQISRLDAFLHDYLNPVFANKLISYPLYQAVKQDVLRLRKEAKEELQPDRMYA